MSRFHRPVLGASIVVVALSMGLGSPFAPGAQAESGVVAKGWADGGDGHDATSRGARSQVGADNEHAARLCAQNAALLFRVRGSGNGYGDGDKLGGWSLAAGTRLISRGWNVRDMQAIYDAPGVPLDDVGAAFTRAASVKPVALRPAALVAAGIYAGAKLKVFRDVATAQWAQVRDQLVSAADRCPQRKILVVGYSQGAIVLRSVLNAGNLPERVRAQIAHVDLLADPTADARADQNIPHGRGTKRLTENGIDTYLARRTHAPFYFAQDPIANDVAARTTQHCKLSDLVCDVTPGSLMRANTLSKRHGSYSWASIGRAAANTLAKVKVPRTPSPSSRRVFAVMNTSESPPDGVWFRRTPRTADTDRVVGHGVYQGERVELQCFGWGDAVGSFGNTLWYHVTNVTRPTNAGAANTGWLNAHYVNDGKLANEVVAGVAAC